MALRGTAGTAGTGLGGANNRLPDDWRPRPAVPSASSSTPTWNLPPEGLFAQATRQQVSKAPSNRSGSRCLSLVVWRVARAGTQPDKGMGVVATAGAERRCALSHTGRRHLHPHDQRPSGVAELTPQCSQGQAQADSPLPRQPGARWGHSTRLPWNAMRCEIGNNTSLGDVFFFSGRAADSAPHRCISRESYG
jgi:hypothetical protein